MAGKASKITKYFLEYSVSIPESRSSNSRELLGINKKLNEVCGVPEHGAIITGLVYGGQSASHGQFPW